MNNPRLEYLRRKTHHLPLEPGVYIMKNKAGQIIYIGKAKILKNRVSSYFRSVEKHLPKVYRMVEQVHDFDYIVTDSEFEALVLECSLIKLHSPKYNILLKDDKGYYYIRVSTEDYPRITESKQKLEDGAEYIGPYTSIFVVKQTVDEVNKAFALPVCTRKFPEDFGKGRPCLNFHIKQCMGVCRGKISKEEYGQILGEAIQFIKGGTDGLLHALEERMALAAENLDFERAARYRDRISAIRRISEQQKVIFNGVQDQDFVAVVQSVDNVCAAVLKFRRGRLVDKEDFLLGETIGLEAARKEFLTGYYGPGREIPKIISLDESFEDAGLVAQFLTKQAGRNVELSVPMRGERKKIMEMAKNNAAQKLTYTTGRTGKEVNALDELARLLGLEKPPKYIEAYDISNIGSSTIVAGMITFENGRPYKAGYKKFNILGLNAPDDYQCMAHVLARRLKRWEEQKTCSEHDSFYRLPDLILLDGGKGHVNAVRPVLESFGLSIPVFGMVKDDKHRTRAIAQNGGEIAIKANRSVFTLISSIQDEVHRFSIQFSRAKHQKTGFELEIRKVPGIGEARARELFRYFKTVKAMKKASEEVLAACPGMTKKTAAALYDFLHSGENLAPGGED